VCNNIENVPALHKPAKVKATFATVAATITGIMNFLTIDHDQTLARRETPDKLDIVLFVPVSGSRLSRR
jgi:hypothetical protein